MARKDVVQIRCTEIEKDRWRQAAAQDNQELSAWIRNTLDKTARLAEARQAISQQDDDQ